MTDHSTAPAPGDQSVGTDRWSSPDLAAEVWRRLAKGETPDELGLGMSSGRTDLRGWPGTAALPEGDRFIASRPLEGLDLTGADLTGLSLAECRIIDCVLNATQAAGWRLFGCGLLGCDVIDVDMSGLSMGPTSNGAGLVRNSTFTRVDLTDAQFDHVILDGVTFIDCTFRRTLFTEVSLHNVTISGPVDQLAVLHEADEQTLPALQLDLRRATIGSFTTDGYRLDSVTLPAASKSFVVRDYGAALGRVRQRLEGLDPRIAEPLTAFVDAELGTRPAGGRIVTPSDYLRDAPEPGTTYLRLLREADQPG